jgi:hypothetical protein
MEKELKLAVLIDAENIASKYTDVILSEANNLGVLIYKRIYGDWTNPQMSSWRNVVLDNSIQPIQQYSNVSGKNSSDSSLIIDAMDLLYGGRVDGFCIVSSDSDFTRLASRMRESEMAVFGMGEQKTPRSFISACNKFFYLDLLYAAGKSAEPVKGSAKSAPPRAASPKRTRAAKPAKPETGPVAEVPAASPPQTAAVDAGLSLRIVTQTLRELTEENSDDDGWIFSGKLGALLTKRFPDFDVRNFGSKKFIPFIKGLGIFETKALSSDDASKLVYIRLK